MRVMWPQ